MKWRKALLVGAGIVGTSLCGRAQVINSNTATISLNATVAESLTVSLGSSALNWSALNPAAGAALNPPDGNTQITVTTTWVLRPGRNQLRLYAFFGTAVALFSVTGGAGSMDIPASAFQINSANLGVLTAVNQSNAAVPGSSLILRDTTISGANRNGTSADTLSFNIDLSSAAMQQLPADTYQGTLNIMAQATP